MKKIKAFTLIELLVVVAIIALLIAILLPSLQKAREMSKQTYCSTNVRNIGTQCYVYQGDNLGIFPIAPHAINGTAIPIMEYVGNMGGGGPGNAPARDVQSIAADPGQNGTTLLSTTRSFWILVRGGDIIPKNFVCPSTGDTVDPTVDVQTYFDFIGFSTVSYGYQVPYDAVNNCRPSADVDPRMVLVADRSPWSAVDPNSPADGGDDSNPNFFNDRIVTYASDLHTQLLQGNPPSDPPPTIDSPPETWRLFNSSNHGGQGSGQGQSCLFPDGHVEFASKPIVGADQDNIYTQMAGYNWQNQDFIDALIYGNYNGGSIPNPVDDFIPGIRGLGPNSDAFTDTMIYP